MPPSPWSIHSCFVAAVAVMLAVGPVSGQAPPVTPSPYGSVAPGPFVRMVRHNDGSRTVTAKDATKNEQEILTYDSAGDLRLRRLYQLDRYGKATTFVIQDGTGRPVLRGEFTYDVRDRMSEERLYSLPGNQMIRRLVQDYDPNTGKKLTPRVQNLGSFPEELLYWMDPDSAQPGAMEAAMKADRQRRAGAGSGTSGAGQTPSPDKPGFLRNINPFKRDK